MNTILILICLIASGVNSCFYSPPTARGHQKICSELSTVIENEEKPKDKYKKIQIFFRKIISNYCFFIQQYHQKNYQRNQLNFKMF